jgi:P27 family predicted phage terminase small subunit
MARRGPKPRNPGLKLLHGAKVTPSRQDPTAGIPGCPDWLDEAAAGLWAELCGVLDERKTICRADGPALAVLCASYGQWRRAVAELEASGFISETAVGNPKPSPLVAAVNQCSASLLAWLREFGLTPASRGRVEPIAGLVMKDPLEEFLSH